MKRRELLMVLCGAGPLAAVCLAAQGKGKGKGKGQSEGKGNSSGKGNGGGAAVYFRREDYAVVQRYYGGPRDLPPGLRKKYYKTGKLPPGWEKKIRPFPVELVRVLPPPPPNCAFGYIEGVAVVYNKTTRIILDSIDIVAALAGH